jgi:hypothetical protein
LYSYESFSQYQVLAIAMTNFRKGHNTKEYLLAKLRKKKDGRSQKDAVASSTGSATSSNDTSVTDRSIPQPVQTVPDLASSEYQSTAQQSAPQPAAVVSSAPLPSPTATVSTAALLSATPPTTATNSRSETDPPATVVYGPPTLQEHLWNLAYDGLRADEPQLVEAYEKILSRELDRNVGAGQQDNIIAQRNPDMRWSQMGRLVQIGLKKTEEEARMKHVTGEAMQFALSANQAVGFALQAVPQAALAWTGVCFALQVNFTACSLTY